MKLSYFPQIKFVHTSKIFFGQIYIPFANWSMMVGTVIITAVYNNVSDQFRRLVFIPDGRCKAEYERQTAQHSVRQANCC